MNEIINQHRELSLFELHRIRSALSDFLDDSVKNAAIKKFLRVGQEINYFCDDANDLITGTIIDIRRTTVKMQIKDWQTIVVPFCMLNLDDIDTDIKHDNVDKTTLKVRDRVGFVKDGIELYGVVTKLSTKTASLLVNARQKWRVSYKLLFYVIDGHKRHLRLV